MLFCCVWCRSRFVVAMRFDTHVVAKMMKYGFNSTGLFNHATGCNLANMATRPLQDFALNMVHELIHLNNLITNRGTIPLVFFCMDILCCGQKCECLSVGFVKIRVVAVVVVHVETQAVDLHFEPA